MSNNTSQGIYSPLPQSISDSDSEKEVDSSRQKFMNLHSNNGLSKKSNSDYQNGFSIPNHMIEKPKPNRGFTGMSTTRKCCFIFSILLCFVTIFVFLWVLPCSEGTCPMKVSNWDQSYEGIEMMDKINIVSGIRGKNLVVLYKADVNGTAKSGAISVLGNSGRVAWFIPQPHPPKHIDCTLIDVTQDGISDCLLLGELGIEAIEPISGNILWHVHTDAEPNPITALNFPTVIPDLNGDGVNDLIVKMTNSKNKCIVVSGKGGIVLYEFLLKGCVSVPETTYEEKYFVYLCFNGTTSTYYRIAINDLQLRVHNKKIEIESSLIDYRKHADKAYMRSGCKLLVNNKGNCPICNTTISLYDMKTKRFLWNSSHENTYAMKPTSFSFVPSATSPLKGKLNGFIVKLWQWSSSEGIYTGTIRKRSVPTNNSPKTKTNKIMERVVLILFNDTNVHVTNSSASEITQLCFPSANGELECQPNMKNQNESLIIGDLDGDGSQELISFSSTYADKLVSNMKIIRLEAELPKLYETAK